MNSRDLLPFVFSSDFSQHLEVCWGSGHHWRPNTFHSGQSSWAKGRAGCSLAQPKDGPPAGGGVRGQRFLKVENQNQGCCPISQLSILSLICQLSSSSPGICFKGWETFIQMVSDFTCGFRKCWSPSRQDHCHYFLVLETDAGTTLLTEKLSDGTVQMLIQPAPWPLNS